MSRLLHRVSLSLLLLGFGWHHVSAWGQAETDDTFRVAADAFGRVESVRFGKQSVNVTSDVRIAMPGWNPTWDLRGLKGLATTKTPGGRRWAGRLELAPGKFCRIDEELTQDGEACCIRIRVTAEETVAVEGVFFWLNLPVRAYAGGACDLGGGHSAKFPADFSEEGMRFLDGETDRVVIEGLTDLQGFTLDFDRPVAVYVQDARAWKSDEYNLYASFGDSQLTQGETVELTVTMRRYRPAPASAPAPPPAPTPAPTPAPAPTPTPVPPVNLRLDADKRLGRMDGFGGNYCFGIESQVTLYTLKTLRVAWARTAMAAAEWEPENDNDDPGVTDWELLKRRDRADTNLRREFMLARRLQKMGIPYSITVWRLPEWCYAEPIQGERTEGGKVKQGLWPEVLECIGSYLVYAKETHGVTPDFFSFNEPDLGIYVKLTPQEHRDAIRALGERFRALGLKTQCLLGDVANPSALAYILPATADPETMQYVGALAFHTWHGATADTFEKWAAEAERLKLPLLATEVGVDPNAWREKGYRRFEYGLQEVRLYQDLIRYARPRAAMQWEFTSDYGLVDERPGPATSEGRLVPHSRYWFLKHFCNLTPPDADILETTSDCPDVLMTALRGSTDPDRTLALHIANLGEARSAMLTGLPADLHLLDAVRTSRDESFKEQPRVTPEQGTLRLMLAPRSLLTLTTPRIEAEP